LSDLTVSVGSAARLAPFSVNLDFVIPPRHQLVAHPLDTVSFREKYTSVELSTTSSPPIPPSHSLPLKRT